MKRYIEVLEKKQLKLKQENERLSMRDTQSSRLPDTTFSNKDSKTKDKHNAPRPKKNIY